MILECVFSCTLVSSFIIFITFLFFTCSYLTLITFFFSLPLLFYSLFNTLIHLLKWLFSLCYLLLQIDRWLELFIKTSFIVKTTMVLRGFWLYGVLMLNVWKWVSWAVKSWLNKFISTWKASIMTDEIEIDQRRTKFSGRRDLFCYMLMTWLFYNYAMRIFN